MRTLTLLLLLPAAVLAQADKLPKPVARAAQEEKAPETPRDFAWRLLDQAHLAVGKAQPAAQASLLWRIADCYVLLDKKKSLELLEQAFTVAGATTGSTNDPLESFIVRSVGDLDLKRAAEMVRAIPPDSRNTAIGALMPKLIDKGKFDDAVELIEAGSGKFYPFDSVRMLLKALKDDDDPRRAIVFGNAITGYQTNPVREFGQMVKANWEHLPRASVVQALDAIVAKVSTYKDDATIFKLSMSGAKGSIDLNTEGEIELFDVLIPMERLEPGKLEEVYENYPRLKAAHNMFPEGEFSGGMAVSYSGVKGMSDQQKSEMAQEGANFSQSMMLKQQAEALAPDELAKALEKVKLIPMPYQAEAMIAIAEQRMESDSTTAHDLLSKAMDILAKQDVEHGDGVAQGLAEAAGDAHKLKDDQLTRRALDLAFGAAGKLLKADVDPDDPNTIPEDMWPSTHNFRNAMRKAEQVYGMGASAYLERIPNTDMYLFSQVALAAALLHREQNESWGGRSRKKN